MPYQISQDTHLWHEAFNSNVNMIQRKVCLFRRSHRPCLKRNHSVYLTSFSLIYAILIFHFSVTQDAFDTVCNIRDAFYCETHVTIKKTRDIYEGKSPSGMGKLNHKQPKKYYFMCMWITCMSCPDFHCDWP